VRGALTPEGNGDEKADMAIKVEVKHRQDYLHWSMIEYIWNFGAQYLRYGCFLLLLFSVSRCAIESWDLTGFWGRQGL
jgi:hypothetical protein